MLALFALPAFAQGISSPALGHGNSGPAVLDPAAVYFNPGLVGYYQRPTFLLGGALIIGDLRYQRDRRALYQREDSLHFAQPVPGEAIDASKSGLATEVQSVPVAPTTNLFAVVPIIKDHLVAGLGIYIPQAAALNFTPDGAQRYQVTNAFIVGANVNPVLAWRINQYISIGAGVSYVLGYADFARMQDFASLDDVGDALRNEPLNQPNSFGAAAPPGVRELAVTSRPISLDRLVGHSFTFGAGVAVKPIEQLTLGLTYQHGNEMNFNGTFRLNMNDEFFTQDLRSQGLAFKPYIQGDATLSFAFPRSFMFGASAQVHERIGLGLSATYTMYSQVDAFRVAVKSPDLAQPTIGLGDQFSMAIPRRWNDTFAIDVHGRVRLLDNLEVWVGGGYHTPASPDETVDLASIDGHRINGTAGLVWAITPAIAAVAEAKVSHVLDRTVVTSDFDLGNGTYRETLYIGGLYLRVTLGAEEAAPAPVPEEPLPEAPLVPVEPEPEVTAPPVSLEPEPVAAPEPEPAPKKKAGAKKKKKRR